MGCSGCEIQKTLDRAVKRSRARPRDLPIATSSKLVSADQIEIIDEHGHRAVPGIVGVSDGLDDGGVA